MSAESDEAPTFCKEHVGVTKSSFDDSQTTFVNPIDVVVLHSSSEKKKKNEEQEQDDFRYRN